MKEKSMTKAAEEYYMMKAADHIRAALTYIGFDAYSEHMKDTPRRVVEAWTSFVPTDEVPFTFTMFENSKINQMVMAKNITVAGLCPHHLMPWRGLAHVAYIPHKRVAGISKLVRAAQWASRRAAVQEEVGNMIADLLNKELEPQGIGVVIEAQHDCVACRGAEDGGLTFVTSVLRGLMFNNPVTRDEFLQVVGRGK